MFKKASLKCLHNKRKAISDIYLAILYKLYTDIQIKEKTAIYLTFITLISFFISGCVATIRPVAPAIIITLPNLYIRTGNYFESYPIYKYKNDYYLYKRGKYVRHHHRKPKIKYIETGRYYDGRPIYKFKDVYYLKQKNGSYIRHRHNKKMRNKKDKYYRDSEYHDENYEK